MIEVSGLTKFYGDFPALRDVTFTVPKGEILAFLGPNGAGKSTTMKILTGYISPSAGSASVAGTDVIEHPLEVRRRIGYLPETTPLYYDMQVNEFLSFTARLRESVGGDLAVGVPGRDFFVAVSLKSPEMLEHVRGRVKEDFGMMDHPLTDRLLLLTADGACEYCDPEAA